MVVYGSISWYMVVYGGIWQYVVPQKPLKDIELNISVSMCYLDKTTDGIPPSLNLVQWWS